MAWHCQHPPSLLRPAPRRRIPIRRHSSSPEHLQHRRLTFTRRRCLRATNPVRPASCHQKGQRRPPRHPRRLPSRRARTPTFCTAASRGRTYPRACATRRGNGGWVRCGRGSPRLRGPGSISRELLLRHPHRRPRLDTTEAWRLLQRLPCQQPVRQHPLSCSCSWRSRWSRCQETRQWLSQQTSCPYELRASGVASVTHLTVYSTRSHSPICHIYTLLSTRSVPCLQYEKTTPTSAPYSSMVGVEWGVTSQRS